MEPNHELDNKSEKQLLTEIHTILLGVPGTDEKGVVGKLRELSEQTQGISRAVQTNTTWRKAFAWVIGVIITAVGIMAGIIVTSL